MYEKAGAILDQTWVGLGQFSNLPILEKSNLSVQNEVCLKQIWQMTLFRVQNTKKCINYRPIIQRLSKKSLNYRKILATTSLYMLFEFPLHHFRCPNYFPGQPLLLLRNFQIQNFMEMLALLHNAAPKFSSIIQISGFIFIVKNLWQKTRRSSWSKLTQENFFAF